MEKKKTKLQRDYAKVVNNYIKEFEKLLELELDFWVANNIGGIALFGDYFIDFDQLRFMVDNNFTFTEFIRWYDYILDETHEKINLENYFKIFLLQDRATEQYYKGFKK